MRVSALIAVASLPLLSQVPDAAFFKGDPKAILVACAEKVRGLKPKSAEPLAFAGRAFLAAGERAKAEEAFKASLALNVDNPDSHVIILGSWVDFGFPKEALETLQVARNLYPCSEKNRGWKNAMAKMGAVLMTGNQPTEAEACMQAAFAKGPSDWQNMTFFGRACLRAGKPELAAPWFSRAVKSAPKDESIWNDIALSLADQGREN